MPSLGSSSHFNPRTPVGCDTKMALTFREQIISIHAPQWGATAQKHLQKYDKTFQSTHPSGVRRVLYADTDGMILISIHAPQWGATQWHGGHHRRQSISIHAPQWGATIPPRRGGHHRQISIHAPQWGATSTRPARSTCSTDFNPRTPVGCDSSSPTPLPRVVEFQSTHPSGVRRV